MTTESYMLQKTGQPSPQVKMAFPPDDRRIVSEVKMHLPELIIERVDLTEAEAEERRERPHVLRVEKEGTAFAPPQPPEESMRAFSSRVTAQQARVLHGVEAAWKAGASGFTELIAVLDTGISRALYENLKAAGRLPFGMRTTLGSRCGYDDSPDSHGSWCVRCAAGVAPEAKILPIQVLDPRTGSGPNSGIVAGIDDAVKSGAGVISLSLGGPGGPLDAISRAVDAARRAGVTVVVAAGNEQEGSTRPEADLTQPASAALAVCVAAVDSDLLIARFSNRGSCVDAAGIGVLVEAGGVYMSGTSMATPHVAGIAALVRDVIPPEEPRAALAEQAIYAAARDTTAAPDREGRGFVVADAAVRKLLQPPPVPGARQEVGVGRAGELPVPIPPGEVYDLTNRRRYVGTIRNERG